MAPKKGCWATGWGLGTHRNEKTSHFRQGVCDPGMSLRRSRKCRNLHVQVLEEMGIATVAAGAQLLLLPSVPHRAAPQHGHLAHGVLLQALHRVAFGSEQLSHEIELSQTERKCNENVYLDGGWWYGWMVLPWDDLALAPPLWRPPSRACRVWCPAFWVFLRRTGKTGKCIRLMVV